MAAERSRKQSEASQRSVRLDWLCASQEIVREIDKLGSAIRNKDARLDWILHL